jgi:hypothetical protein
LGTPDYLRVAEKSVGQSWLHDAVPRSGLCQIKSAVSNTTIATILASKSFLSFVSPCLPVRLKRSYGKKPYTARTPRERSEFSMSALACCAAQNLLPGEFGEFA